MRGDDQMVVQHDVDRLQRFLDAPSHLDVGIGREDVTRRVIVREKYGRGMQLKGTAADLAGTGRRTQEGDAAVPAERAAASISGPNSTIWPARRAASA